MTVYLRTFWLLLICTMLAGCTAIPQSIPDQQSLPPVLAQHELLRRYVVLGRVQVSRQVYLTDYHYDPNLQEWALNALRHEARKLHADAIILPEFASRKTDIILFPSFPATEYKASATAIRFE